MSFRSVVVSTDRLVGQKTQVFEAQAGDVEAWVTVTSAGVVGGPDVTLESGLAFSANTRIDITPGDSLWMHRTQPPNLSGEGTAKVLIRSID